MTTLGLMCISTHADFLYDVMKWAKWTKLFDEIIIIADSDGGPEVEEVAKEYATQYLVKKINYVEEVIQDAINLSHTDWQFKLDDDERTGESFVNGIKNLLGTTSKDAFWVRRFWLYPDREHSLKHHRWGNDYQPRLWRKGTAHGVPQLHQYPQLSANYDHLEWGIYHFALLEPLEYRLAKCQEYADIWKMSLEDYNKNYGLYLLPEYFENSKLKITPIEEKFEF